MVDVAIVLSDEGDLAEPEEYGRFRELTRKLLTVPKRDIDAERANGKNGSH